MRYSVSNTAEFGTTLGPEDHHRTNPCRNEEDPHRDSNRQFAKEWILENRAGAPAFKAQRRLQKNHLIEQVGGACGS